MDCSCLVCCKTFFTLEYFLSKVSIYFTKGSLVSVEKLSRMTKNDVRRTAAKLNRDEKAQTRFFESSVNDSQLSVSSAQLSNQSAAPNNVRVFEKNEKECFAQLVQH